MLESLKRLLYETEDKFFAYRYRLDLAGIVRRDNLVTDSKESLAHATAYHAVWSRNLRRLINEARKIGIDFENFVDIGSGKGKACFYAHSRGIFQSIVGVEFSSPLVDIAKNNLKRFPSATMEFVHADASDFLLPSGRTLVFMFNPFGSPVLQRFLQHNIDHFRSNKSIIAYANDLERTTLARNGFATIYRDQDRKISLHGLL